MKSRLWEGSRFELLWPAAKRRELLRTMRLSLINSSGSIIAPFLWFYELVARRMVKQAADESPGVMSEHVQCSGVRACGSVHCWRPSEGMLTCVRVGQVFSIADFNCLLCPSASTVLMHVFSSAQSSAVHVSFSKQEARTFITEALHAILFLT